MAAANRDIFGKIERERGFPLRRTRRQNQKLRTLKSRRQFVEFRVTGRNSGDALAFAKDFFEALEIVANDVLDRDEAGTHAIFGKREDRRFGVVENGVGAIFAIERAHLDVVRRVNQVPQNRFFLVRISAVNSSGNDVILPRLSVEDDKGTSYPELTNDVGAPQWIGMLRQVHPADSIAGNLVFDCPPGHYKLQLTDDLTGHAALVDIPLSFTSETPDVPIPGEPKKK